MPRGYMRITVKSNYPAWSANFVPPKPGDARGETSYRVGSHCPTCKPQTEWTRRQVLVGRIWRRQCCGSEVR